jgi:hypothetical protein
MTARRTSPEFHNVYIEQGSFAIYEKTGSSIAVDYGKRPL